MKKSTLITLVTSILLIILGFVLVGLGLSASYSTNEYRFGRNIYIESSFVSHSLQSRILTSFGQMTFVLGIAGIFLFAYLAIKNPKVKEETAKAAKQQPGPVTIENIQPVMEETVAETSATDSFSEPNDNG